MNSELIIYLAGTVLSIAITFGMIKSKMDRVAEDIKEVERRLYQIRDDYITRQEFTATITQMREDHAEIRDDIKRVLELLSK